MAESATPLINLRYQDGSEGSPSNPVKFKNQDFAKLKDYCHGRGGLFVDMEFPPNGRSLGDLTVANSVKWLRPRELLHKQNNKDEPAFIVDGTSRFDFGQGQVGNCWFVAAISAGTFQENLMAQVVPMEQSFENYAGIFHFRFWRFGKWVDVVIDDYLPTINMELLSVSSKCGNEFWAPLMEKAYAKVCGSYADMEAGYPSEACKDFTGGVNQTYTLKEPNSPDHGEIWLTLRRATDCKSLICCGTPSKLFTTDSDIDPDTGLVNSHAYSITGITEVDLNGAQVRLVRVMNPHGELEWNGRWSDKSDLWSTVKPEDQVKYSDRDDGEFWMQLEDFCCYFSDLSICSETPNFTDGDFTCQWKCVDYEGSWVANRSALVNKDIPTFASNPQYRIQVSVTDKEEPKSKSILISLIQKPHQGYRKKIVPHEFDIYKIPPGTPRRHLDNSFFDSLVEATQVYSNERELVKLHNLDPGEYVIIPSALEDYITADFVLTVYTKADAKISVFEVGNDVGGDDDEDNDHLSEICDKDKEKATDEDPNLALFQLYTDQNCELSARQLQKLLKENFPCGNGHRGFSLDTCRSMIALVDLDQRMTMTTAKFSVLWKKIQEYKNLFYRSDVNKNGSLSNHELRKAIEAAGMNVNDGIVGLMMFRYSGSSTTSLENFITLMLRLDKMSGIFNGKSTDGAINLTWEEWLITYMYN
ncbi:calpain-8-like [Archocentrus centrarchus]|uniref:calpain-8-like n=1 Tax=Archocentrus centrarchus TaxID=63155 RepID=UPI0011EA2E41|nr:calpain-8-like [Archocentrus centrarchus]